MRKTFPCHDVTVRRRVYVIAVLWVRYLSLVTRFSMIMPPYTNSHHKDKTVWLTYLYNGSHYTPKTFFIFKWTSVTGGFPHKVSVMRKPSWRNKKFFLFVIYQLDFSWKFCLIHDFASKATPPQSPLTNFIWSLGVMADVLARWPSRGNNSYRRPPPTFVGHKKGMEFKGPFY